MTADGPENAPNFYHVCFAVPDLERAMADLSAAVGCSWHEPRHDQLGDWSYEVAFSEGGLPLIELIRGSEGSPWDASRGARFDHLGYWTTSVEAGTRRLANLGFPEAFSGCPYGRPFAINRVDSIGAGVELFAAAAQPYFLDSVGLAPRSMTAIDEADPPRDR